VQQGLCAASTATAAKARPPGAAELLGDQRRLDGAAAEAADRLGQARRQPAHVANCAQWRGLKPPSCSTPVAALLEAVVVIDEAAHAVAQQGLWSSSA